MSNNLLSQFLKARELIDTDIKNTITNPKPNQPNVMDKPRPEMEDSVRTIIETKPSKKVVMEFLKRKVAQYTDETSDDDL